MESTHTDSNYTQHTHSINFGSDIWMAASRRQDPSSDSPCLQKLPGMSQSHGRKQEPAACVFVLFCFLVSMFAIRYTSIRSDPMLYLRSTLRYFFLLVSLPGNHYRALLSFQLNGNFISPFHTCTRIRTQTRPFGTSLVVGKGYNHKGADTSQEQ